MSTSVYCFLCIFWFIPPPGGTNSEFNFRHDWNSLISDDESLLMKHYTKDYFPKADVYVSLYPCTCRNLVYLRQQNNDQKLFCENWNTGHPLCTNTHSISVSAAVCMPRVTVQVVKLFPCILCIHHRLNTYKILQANSTWTSSTKLKLWMWVDLTRARCFIWQIKIMWSTIVRS